METYFYQAECGDAARIRYIGSDNKPHNIFIDAGYERTYSHVLSKEIENIGKAGESIDLWIISHIHDDHIGGVMSYINAIQSGEITDIVKSWYYNPPRIGVVMTKDIAPPSISFAKSIRQGDELVTYLAYKNMVLNFDISTKLPTQDFFGLKITILSPSPSKLNALRKKYSQPEYKTLNYQELTSISEATAAKSYDYNIPIESFALKKWKEDDSIENGSSIAFLTEFQNKKTLWLADSHPSIVIKSLQKLGYSKDNPLICDWVKVTHHGSKGNNSSELYELIQCNNYLMSVNGENKDYLPAKECIAQILLNSNRDIKSTYNFHFTYDNDVLRSIFNVDDKNIFEKWNFTMNYLKNNKWIRIPL